MQAFSSPKPRSQDADLAAQQMAESQARAQREQAELDHRRRLEEDARRLGARGVRSLLSDAGGYLGFKSTLGG